MTYRSTLLLALWLPCAVVAPAAAAEFDACQLITGDEIEAVQGEAVALAKGQSRTGGGLLFAQCYYELATHTNSVSLQVTLADPTASKPASPAEQWQTAFHTGPNAGADRDKEAPQPVASVGDEAFWSSDAFVGVLYARKGDAFIRISVGGGNAEGERLEESKELARKALGRL